MSPLRRGTPGTEPARLSAGTEAGGGTGTIIPAAGSAVGPGRDPSAEPKEPEGELQTPPAVSRGRPGGNPPRGRMLQREEKPRHSADRAKLLAGSCLQGGCSTAASINLWGTSASAAQA